MLSSPAVRVTRLRSIPPYLLSSIRRTMSSTSAYIVPFDHRSSSQVVPGLNPAELWALTPTGERAPKVGTTRTFYNTPPSKVTTISSLGPGFANKGVNAKRELLRKSVGKAVKELKEVDGLKDVAIDASIDPHAAGMHKIPPIDVKVVHFRSDRSRRRSSGSL
jgi:hypothetical protein